MKLQGYPCHRLKSLPEDGGETFKEHMDLDMLEAHPTYFHYELDDHCFSFVCLNQFEWNFTLATDRILISQLRLQEEVRNE